MRQSCPGLQGSCKTPSIPTSKTDVVEVNTKRDVERFVVPPTDPIAITTTHPDESATPEKDRARTEGMACSGACEDPPNVVVPVKVFAPLNVCVEERDASPLLPPPEVAVVLVVPSGQVMPPARICMPLEDVRE